MDCEQVLVAIYESSSNFLVPRGIDLNKCEHWVKYDTLYIDIGEEEPLEIEAIFKAYEDDFKRPSHYEIETVEDLGMEDYYEDANDDIKGKIIHKIRLKKVHKELLK